MKNQMKKFASITIMAIMLLSMVSATYVTEGQTQEVVNSGVPVYVGDADIAPEPSSAQSGTLREGQTTYHYYNGEKYELTLVYVSDAMYWEDETDYEKDATADVNAPSLSNKPSAKFAINGEVTQSLHPGEKDETRSGTIKVTTIGNSVTEQGDKGTASYIFYPKTTPPPNGDYVKLKEGQEHDLVLNGQKFEIKLKEANPQAALFEVESERGETQVKVRVGGTASANGLYFNLRDASYDWALIGNFRAVSVVPQEPIKDSLKEGETETYRWNGQEYELTLIFVSDPMYWEDSAGNTASDAEKISNRPTAKFMLNGEVSDGITVGGYDQLECGKISVNRIDSTGREGAATYTLWPKSCSVTLPPNPNQVTDTLKTGTCKTYEIADFELETCYKGIEEINYAAVCIKTEYDDCASPGPATGLAWFTINSERVRAYEGHTAGFTTGKFNGKLYVKDADQNQASFSIQGRLSTQACTEELKACPDGSYVARTGDDCSFAPCPSEYDGSKEQCYASGGRWECAVHAHAENEYDYADAEYNNDCRCYYPPTPQPYSAEECQERGGRWECPESVNGYNDAIECRCIQTNMPPTDPYDPAPCYEGCAEGDDCGCNEPSVPVPSTGECASGCLKGDRCLPYGTRLANGEAVYCSIEEGFQTQLADGSSCQNSYECVSNQCLNAECQSLDKEIRNTQSLLKRILGWFGLA